MVTNISSLTGIKKLEKIQLEVLEKTIEYNPIFTEVRFVFFIQKIEKNSMFYRE